MRTVCGGCDRSDQLYSDRHGTFCHRCGPGVPVRSTFVFERKLSMTPEVLNVVVLSTGHVSEQTSVMLRRPVSEWPCSGGPYGDVGWFVYCHEDQGDPSNMRDFIPDDLFAAMTYARTAGHSYILFDRDAPKIEDLETFDW